MNMSRMTKAGWVVAFALLLGACASVPTDPNIAALAASNERLQAQANAHAEALADSRATAAVACANAEEPAVCALGQVAMTLASERGNTAPANPLNNYRAPPTRMQQWVQGAAAVGSILNPAIGGYVALESRRSDNAAQVAITGINAQRETGIVQALTGLGTTIANQPPGVYVGGNYGDTYGDNFTGGDRTDTRTDVGGNLGDTSIVEVGRDQIGGDRTDNNGVIGDDNDTRFGSPGPIDDHSDPGDDCTGESCNPVEPAPVPESP